MNIETLEKQQMDIVKEMASTNMKISEAKNILFKLQEDETEYLEEREKKALTKISNVLSESKDLLKQTSQNYEDIHKFCQTVSEYADFISETHKKLQAMLQLFKEKNDLWDTNAKLQYTEIARQRKIVEQDADGLKEREKRINEATESLKKEREHLASQQATLLAAYKVEQELWNKIQRK